MKFARVPSNAICTPTAPVVSLLLIFFASCLIPTPLDAKSGKQPDGNAPLYQFTGGVDGGTPTGGVVFDPAGNLYGSAASGGTFGHGAVYKLSLSGGSWTETVLYSFTGGQDGDTPLGGVVFDGAGNLWGTTFQGGDPACKCGTFFELSPSGNTWTFSLIHAFLGPGDGANPEGGLLYAFGFVYGTTSAGGTGCSGFGCGTIFWNLGNYHVYSYFTLSVGAVPVARLFPDLANACLVGTTEWGAGGGWGTVFVDCDPGAIVNQHTFSLKSKVGINPLAGVIEDNSGNIYGTTSAGFYNSGTVFELGKGLHILHQFLGPDGSTPAGDLVFDVDGNLYGTTVGGGANNQGVVFKLTPGLKNWTETLLYSFAGSDGANPGGSLVFDGADNLYGTASAGGAHSAGVVFKVPNIRVGPKATLAPTSLRFPKQVINTSSSPKAVTLTNTGDTVLTINNISITPSGNFAISSNTCEGQLGLGKQCTVSVTFSPTSLGKLAATLTFSDNAPNSPQTVPLSGTSVLPATLTPTSATYPKQAVGTTSSPKTFTLTNNQAVSLNNIVISTTGDFAVSATTCSTSLAANSKCTISVTFTPTQIGTRTGTLSVSDSANNSPQTSNLTGTGD